MRYLLDSDILSDLYEPSSLSQPIVLARFSALKDVDVAVVSILAVYELEYGFENAPADLRPEIRRRIVHLQSEFQLLPLTPSAALEFGALKARLRDARGLSPQGLKRHNIDLMLAATAIAEQCILVSGDSLYPELQLQSPGLQVENWFLA